MNVRQGAAAEAECLAALGGGIQPRSGAGKRHKEDLVIASGPNDSGWLLQVKSTRTRRITISVDDLRKLITHAQDTDLPKKPGVVFVIKTDVPALSVRKWILIPVEEWGSCKRKKT